MHGADIHIFADVIEERLGVSCSALSGANIADEVAKDRFSETTIGYRKEEEGKIWQKLFATDNFRVNLVADVGGRLLSSDSRLMNRSLVCRCVVL